MLNQCVLPVRWQDAPLSTMIAAVGASSEAESAKFVKVMNLAVSGVVVVSCTAGVVVATLA